MRNADTGPLYAAIDPDDQYHERAQEQLNHLSNAGITGVLIYPILSEARAGSQCGAVSRTRARH